MAKTKLLPKEVYCSYCGHQAVFVDSAEVYGKSYGMIYLCRPCQAWVGVHPNTSNPLGRLANAELRKWKSLAHSSFDRLWKFKYFSRSGAYFYLSQEMGLTPAETHIGMFDVAQCQKAINISNKFIGFKRSEWRKNQCPLKVPKSAVLKPKPPKIPS